MSLAIQNATGPSDLRAMMQARTEAAQRRADGMVPRSAGVVAERRDNTGAQSMEDAGWMAMQSRLADSASRTVLAQTTASMQPVTPSDAAPQAQAAVNDRASMAAQSAATYAAMQQAGVSALTTTDAMRERSLSLRA